MEELNEHITSLADAVTATEERVLRIFAHKTNLDNAEFDQVKSLLDERARLKYALDEMKDLKEMIESNQTLQQGGEG